MSSVRLSRVGSVKVVSQSNSSVCLFGDSAAINPRSDVFAVQREQSRYLGNEGELEQFQIFQQSLPKLAVQPPPFPVRIRNDSPYIDARSIHILGMSASAVLHVGSTGSIDAETRIKHVRQLLSIKEKPDEEER